MILWIQTLFSTDNGEALTVWDPFCFMQHRAFAPPVDADWRQQQKFWITFTFGFLRIVSMYKRKEKKLLMDRTERLRHIFGVHAHVHGHGSVRNASTDYSVHHLTNACQIWSRHFCSSITNVTFHYISRDCCLIWKAIWKHDVTIHNQET